MTATYSADQLAPRPTAPRSRSPAAQPARRPTPTGPAMPAVAHLRPGPGLNRCPKPGNRGRRHAPVHYGILTGITTGITTGSKVLSHVRQRVPEHQLVVQQQPAVPPGLVRPPTRVERGLDRGEGVLFRFRRGRGEE